MRRYGRDGNDCSVPFSTTKKICRYCEKHRELLEYQDRISERRIVRNAPTTLYEDTSSSRQLRKEFSEDEILFNYTTGSSSAASRRTILESNTIARQTSKLISPTHTSCLKTVTNKRLSNFSKHVNFSNYQTYAKPLQQSFTSEETSTIGDQSKSSSSYYEPPPPLPPSNKTFEKTAIVRRLNSTSDLNKKLNELKRNNDEPFRKTINVRQRQHNNVSRHQQPISSRSSSSSSSDKLKTDDHLLSNEFERLSLASNYRDIEDKVYKKDIQRPKIVKPKDGLKRATVKRMLVYPPEGQTGQPINLVKKWSNIDCHVRGDSQKGYKYKVYYIQEFESDRWLPDSKTGGPFHQINDYSSTDYG